VHRVAHGVGWTHSLLRGVVYGFTPLVPTLTMRTFVLFRLASPTVILMLAVPLLPSAILKGIVRMSPEGSWQLFLAPRSLGP
jgi:hypothetical protein